MIRDRLETPSEDPSDYPNVVDLRAEALPEITPGEAATMWYAVALVRACERWLADHEDLIHGPLHSSIGQEAVAVGAMAAMHDGDQFTASHRAHHQAFAAAVYRSAPAWDVASSDPTPERSIEAVRALIAEILGLRTGVAGGRGGSMHLRDPQLGLLGTSAIVGGGIPMTVGAAYSAKALGSGAVSFAFFGDGATSIGALHESMSLARALGLPAVFVAENNQYSVATSVRETTGLDDLVLRASGHAMPGLVVDGMDPEAVRHGVALARAYATQHGPVLIEAKTYRHLHQSGSNPGSSYGYRTAQEEAGWLARDPLTAYPEVLVGRGIPESTVARIRERAEHDCRQIVAALVEADADGGIRLRPELAPDAATVRDGVLGAAASDRGIREGAEDGRRAGEEVTYVNAISMVMDRAMTRDPRVFVIGEEVGHMRGGAYGATRHACRHHPDRLVSAPIAENGFSGLALGAALTGLRPVVELMFPDFALEGADQLFNHIPKARYMFGGTQDVPLVVRARTAQGRGFGPQHGVDPTAMFAQYPGWRIVAPADPVEYVGLFNAAITGNDPVLVVEHHELWNTRAVLPEEGLDLVLPLGRARTVRAGSDVTVIAWSNTVSRVVAIAEELSLAGIDVEVIDLRSLDPLSWDLETVASSVRRTGHVVVAEDSMASQALAPRLAATLYSVAFEALRGPIRVVTGTDVFAPVSQVLESAVLLSDDDIRDAVVAAVDEAGVLAQT